MKKSIIVLTLLIAGTALGQTEERRHGIVIPPNHGLPRAPANLGLPAAAPAAAGVRSEGPRRTNPFGVRAAAPRPIPIGDQTRAAIPFTRLGPTSRTMYDAERERAAAAPQRTFQQPRPEAQLTPAERIRLGQLPPPRPVERRGFFRRTPIAPMDVRPHQLDPVEHGDAQLGQPQLQGLDLSRPDAHSPDLRRQAFQQQRLHDPALRPLQTAPMGLQPLSSQDLRHSPTPGVEHAPPFEHSLQPPLTGGFRALNRSGTTVEAPWWFAAGHANWPHVPTWGIVAAGGGFYAHGAYSDGRFRARFRTSSPLIPIRGYCPTGTCGTVSCIGGVCRTLAPSTIYGSYLSVGQPAMDPSLVAAVAPPPAPAPVVYDSEAERGDAMLRAGYAAEAITTLRAYLDANPHDAYAMRSMGLAMIARNQVSDGVALVAHAYRTEPALAAYPLPVDAFGTPADLRRILERVSVHANRTNMPSGWLALAALMQAENRNQLAIRMVERAKQAGLEPEVASQMSAALRF
jgi:hypothetical protein